MRTSRRDKEPAALGLIKGTTLHSDKFLAQKLQQLRNPPSCHD